MSDLFKGFLADIVANSDDDTPRLVCADWLDEQGHEGRAEFIRVQIERARLPKWDAAQVRLRLREAELLKKHGTAWRAELPTIEGMSWTGFRRGFVAEANFTNFKTLAAHRNECWATAPIEAVAVRWPRNADKVERMEPLPGLREVRLEGRMVAHADAERLAASPLLSTLRVLDMKGAAMGLEGLRRVVVSPHLGRLEALRVADNLIGDGLGAALRAAPALGSLEEMDLSVAGEDGYYGEALFTMEGMTDLGAWPGMARIRRLNLTGHDCREEQLQALLGAPLAAGLKELILQNNHNYEGWGEIFDAARPELELDVLDITGGRLREPDASSLAGNRRLRHLKWLRTYGLLEEEASDNIRALASSPCMASLRILHLDGDGADPTGIQPLLDAAPPLLHTLTLRDAYLGDEQVVAIGRSPASDTLHELDLRSNNLTAAAAEALGASRHLRNLLTLRIGGNPMGEPGMDVLAASPLGRRLMLLDRSAR